MLEVQKQMTQMQEETKRVKQDGDLRAREFELRLKEQAQSHKENMEKMAEGRKRAELELKHETNIPGAIV